MTIPDLRERSNRAILGLPKDVLLVLIVLLASSGSFGLGILAGRDMGAGKGKEGFWIENVATTTLKEATNASVSVAEQPAAAIAVAKAGAALAPSTGKYLASKNGSKYYLPSCSGAKRIKDTNRVWFSTADEAKQAGYEPAANCPGL